MAVMINDPQVVAALEARFNEYCLAREVVAEYRRGPRRWPDPAVKQATALIVATYGGADGMVRRRMFELISSTDDEAGAEMASWPVPRPDDDLEDW